MLRPSRLFQVRGSQVYTLALFFICFWSQRYALGKQTRAKGKLNTESRRAEQYLPIWFAIPRSKVLLNSSCSNKKQHFARVLPRKSRKEEYTFQTEEEYYREYEQSYFGVTYRKGGWDSLRHYEILARGSVPFFFDIESVPRLSLFRYPKKLVTKVMHLNGTPTVAAVANTVFASRGRSYALKKLSASLLDETKFDKRKYCVLKNQLLEYTRRYLTTSSLAEYVLSQIRKQTSVVVPRSLFIMGTSMFSQTAFLYHGFHCLGHHSSLSAWNGPISGYFMDSGKDTTATWGRGYSLAQTLNISVENSSTAKRTESSEELRLKERLETGYFNVLFVAAESLGTLSRGCCTIQTCYGHETLVRVKRYVRRFSPVVVTIDGNDLNQCHGSLTAELGKVHLHFVRETFNAVTGSLVRSPVTEAYANRSIPY